MRPSRRIIRPAYTLLEITLALAISLLLLATLYYTFTVFIAQTMAGRQVVMETEEVRAVFNKMTDDISSQLGPLDTRSARLPKEFFEVPEELPPEEEGQESTDEGQAEEEAPETDPLDGGYAYFNLGVYGDAERLTLFVGKATDLNLAMRKIDQPIAAMGDLRRVCYWVVQGPAGPMGLARQEIKIPTAPEALLYLPFGEPVQEPYIIAQNVVGVWFEYFDGQTWHMEWDGSLMDTERKQPYGPPLAIGITLEVATGTMLSDGLPETKIFRHTVAIPAANGISQGLSMGIFPLEP